MLPPEARPAFKAALPVTLPKCYELMRQYAGLMNKYERDGCYELADRAAEVIFHIRYRYYKLLDSDEDEAKQFCLIYEIQYPEMYFDAVQSPPDNEPDVSHHQCNVSTSVESSDTRCCEDLDTSKCITDEYTYADNSSRDEFDSEIRVRESEICDIQCASDQSVSDLDVDDAVRCSDSDVNTVGRVDACDVSGPSHICVDTNFSLSPVSEVSSDDNSDGSPHYMTFTAINVEDCILSECEKETVICTSSSCISASDIDADLLSDDYVIGSSINMVNDRPVATLVIQGHDIDSNFRAHSTYVYGVRNFLKEWHNIQYIMDLQPNPSAPVRSQCHLLFNDVTHCVYYADVTYHWYLFAFGGSAYRPCILVGKRRRFAVPSLFDCSVSALGRSVLCSIDQLVVR